MALTNDDLLAISQLLDIKLDAKLKPIEEKIQQVESITSNIQNRVETLENATCDIQGRMEKVEKTTCDIQGRMEKVETQTSKTGLLLEREVSPRLQNIESCYTSTYQRYASGADQIEALQADMEIIKKIVQEHSEKLKEIS
ncbi:hypothetical protein NIA71_01390 [Ihubacter massiliensis]|uniref:hypothetical protein n=1 Tax=Ihubacter massiliensis TaxID=1852367 RepID=UPI00209840A7|nr:hypothetical protein [Ihubacter massiliensis]MCI7300446.1 hypothetical protein [Clostridia bacterium]MCO7120609.1 hypothetical protein [Ihubacter massiliensis]MDY3011468.1 hypothetical protein [Clostridiales Family XIII bacterium]